MKGLFAVILSAGAVSATRPSWKHFPHDVCGWDVLNPANYAGSEMGLADENPSVHDPLSDGLDCTHAFKYTPPVGVEDFDEYGVLQECSFDSSGETCVCDGDRCMDADYTDTQQPICSQKQALYYMNAEDMGSFGWEDLDADSIGGVQEGEIMDVASTGMNVYYQGGCRRIQHDTPVDQQSPAGFCADHYVLSSAGVLTQCVPHNKWGWCHSGESCVLEDNAYQEECKDDVGSDGSCEDLSEMDCPMYSEFHDGEQQNCYWKVKGPSKGKGNGNGNQPKCVPHFTCAAPAAPPAQ